MKYFCIALLIALVSTSLFAADPAPKAKAPKVELGTVIEKVSYGSGLQIGSGMRQQRLSIDDIDLEKFIAGLRDGITKANPQIKPQELQAAMEKFQEELNAKLTAKAKIAGPQNQKDGDAFLAANAKKPGVVTTKSGLQYKILKKGKGKRPTKTDIVSTHYRGTLIDGTEFDNSQKYGGPASFPVERVIEGWVEALQLMPVGSKWQLVVPSKLAYKDESNGPDIGPHATLIFEIELLDIGNPEEPAGPAEVISEPSPGK